jgi:oxygen-dependent protoporphyrinogen oxidase
METGKAIVVGAGITGLGAAVALQDKGYEVQVIEASDRVGGRARTLERKKTGDICDVGTQYYHSNYPRALGLIRRAGLDPSVGKIKGRTRFFSPKVKSGTFLLDHRFPWVASFGATGNIRVAAFLLHRLLRHRLHTYELSDKPALDLVPALEATASPHVQELIKLVSAVGVLAVHEDMSLYQALRLLKIILLTDYVTLAGGVASLHRALAERLDVRLETPAHRIVVEQGRIKGVAVKDACEVLPADHVIIAVPPPQAAKIIPEEWDEERRFLESARIPPSPVVSFFLDRPLEPSVWSYFLPLDHGGAVSMCTDAAQKNPAMVPSGKAILQAFPIHPENACLESMGDEDVVERCRKELEEYLPGLSGWIEEAHVTRHPEGMPQFPTGQGGKALDFLRRVENRPGVSFCGDYFSGGYLEAALWTAERAVQRIG